MLLPCPAMLLSAMCSRTQLQPGSLCVCRAVTEAGSDQEPLEPSKKDMLKLLGPFLAPYPQDSSAASAGQSSTNHSTEPDEELLSAAEEAQAVRHFVAGHIGCSLYQVAAAALEQLADGSLPFKQLAGLSQELMKLESCIRGGHSIFLSEAN